MSGTKAPAPGSGSWAEDRGPRAATAACGRGWWPCGPRRGALPRGRAANPEPGTCAPLPPRRRGSPAPGDPEVQRRATCWCRGETHGPRPFAEKRRHLERAARRELSRRLWEHFCTPRASM